MKFKCAIREDASLPKYEQLKDCILVAIEDGVLMAGDKLPSEPELRDELGISRTTIRRAFQELSDSGHIRIEAGRGSFVVVQAPVDPIKGLHAQLSEQNRDPHTQVLEKRVIDGPSQRLVRKLEIAPNSPVAFIRRLRFATDRPIVLQDVYVPLERCPEILSFDLSHSLYAVFAKLGVSPTVAENEFSASIANEEWRQLLDIETECAAVIVMRQTSRVADGVPIEYVRSVYRSEEVFKTTHIYLSLNETAT